MNRIFMMIIISTVLLLVSNSVPAGAAWNNTFQTGFSGTVESFSEIKQSINEIRGTVEGISRFIGTLKSIADALSSIVGAKAILLFFIVILISSGLGVIGFPRGKFTFFSSLMIADLLWLLLGASIKADLFLYTLMILKSSIIILFPFFIAIILMRLSSRYLKKPVSGFLIPMFLNLFKKKKTKEELSVFSGQLKDESSRLIKSIAEDAERDGNNDKISISKTSHGHIEELKKILESF